MERFFLFCLRPCLKGDDDDDFYKALDIENPKTATPELIKKQYKKLSLAHHPDKLSQRGVEITPEHQQSFLKLKEAYDVLSDPKRKKLYDEYGLKGLKLVENPTELNHVELLKNYQRNHGDRTTLFLVIAFIFAVIFAEPILFSLKCDGTLGENAPWVAIWFPMWIFNLILIVLAIALFFDNEEPETHDDEHNQPKPEKASIYEKLYNLISTSLFILIQIFVLIRLDRYVRWSWFAVFAPWFAYEGVNIIAAIPQAYLNSIPKPNYNQPINPEDGDEDEFTMKMRLETEYYEKTKEQQKYRKDIFVHLLRIWLAIFLALKIDHSVHWNWGLVLLPIWVYLFCQYLMVYLMRLWGAQKLKDIDMEKVMTGQETDPSAFVNYHQGNDSLHNAWMLFFIQLIPLFMAIMLVCRLQSSSYSTFLIILPVFIILGCCCCIVLCGLACFSMVDTDELEEALNKQSPGDVETGNANAENPVSAYSPPTEPTIIPDYGTISKEHETSQSPLVTSSIIVDVPKEESKKAPVETTIDPDID